MTKKDYELIAATIRSAHNHQTPLVYEHEDYDRIVHALSGAFSRENPRFDADRFERACGWSV